MPKLSTRLRALLLFYVLLVTLFVLAKPCFVFAQDKTVCGEVSLSDLLQAVWHGLPLDLATAGYATAPLWLLLGVSLWVRIPFQRSLHRIYCALLAAALALIFVGDSCLYGFWGIKLDGTVWNYLSQPQGALSSVPMGYAMGCTLATVAAGAAIYALLQGLVPARFEASQRRGALTGLWLLLGGLLFLGIRGGVGKSTANVGMAYWTDRPFLHHTAVNPAFSLLASLQKTKQFEDEANFYDEAERARRFALLHYRTESLSPDTLLTTQRPNVLLILTEGCGASFVHAVNPEADPAVTPHLNRLAEEGVVFTQCYANSFRTDRGTLCTLSGFPALPDVSVMKLPGKCGRLPSIAASLRRAGYATEFLYGGDINFTNTNGYLLSTGYERTYGETSFPASVRRTHDWGVTDRIAFDSLYARIVRYPTSRPWHLGFLTLASHEPWKVPYDRLAGDERANAMAYLDDCIGRFVERLRQTPLWDNTLVIILPDHGIPYHDITHDADERKSHIPLIWTGGAIRQARKIDLLCNQTDLAATLLGQLGLPHDDFRFSRDILSQNYTHPSAVHAWSEGIYWKDESGISVVNLLTRPVSTFRESPKPSQQRVNAAKVFLQTAYDALGAL